MFSLTFFGKLALSPLLLMPAAAPGTGTLICGCGRQNRGGAGVLGSAVHILPPGLHTPPLPASVHQCNAPMPRSTHSHVGSSLAPAPGGEGGRAATTARPSRYTQPPAYSRHSYIPATE